jgi:beta-glucanase (GH16 family)
MRSLWLAFLIGWSGSACAATGTSPSVDVPVTITPLGNACLAGSICPPGNWNLVFGDEFNGTVVDTSKWFVQVDGGRGKGNDLLHNSTTLIEGGGLLTLKPDINGAGEVSSLATYGPGYYEVRMKADNADWDLFWTIANANFNCLPITGGFEADIQESIGGGGGTNIHWSGYGSCHTASANGTATATDAFHIWGMLWTASGGLTFYRDGVLQPFNIPGPVGSTPSFIILTGAFVGSPTTTSGLQVDWVRYYQPSTVSVAAGAHAAGLQR